MSGKLTKEELKLLERSGYSEKVIQYYTNKVNVGIIKDADVALAYTGPCGDTVKLYLKFGQKRRIEDAKFQYLGCPGPASSGSALTKMVKGKPLKEAKKITEEGILKDLEGLP